jgi:hypothetical protein
MTSQIQKGGTVADDDPEVLDAEAVEESKPQDKDLVVRGAALDPQAPYRVMDRHDEKQILDEIVGRQIDVMVYSFDGKTDLSYAGVQEVVRTLNARGATRIEVASDPRPEFTEVEDDGKVYIQCTAYARDTLNGGGAWGTATEPKYMKLRNGDTKLDSFARTKALSKAQRNAEKALIPEEFRQLLIAVFKKDKKRVKQLEAGLLHEEDLPALPPPVDTPEMKAKVETARALYVEIQRLAPGGVRVQLTAATFHRYLTRAETDEARMDEFVALLEEKLAEAKKEAE